ncbi:MAG TPA: gliding motility-associated C-terminal domain-containing protein, partial [Bacteroidia bacterium]|nr:gliding motility-associated C-terminal domain-containing protein [Bacteroidia bacterium]
QWFQLPSPIVIGTTPTITVTPPSGTTQYLLVTLDGLCRDSDTVVVTVNPLPIVNTGPTQTIFEGLSATIGGSPTGPAGSTYLWQPSSSLNDSTSADPIATPTTTTTYTVLVTTSTGCTAIDTVTVIVLPQLVIPDGFTPNGDGTNDVWNLRNVSEFPGIVVEVFNRWGEQLFRSAGYKTPWDGTYDGKPLPVGTYYYVINLNDPRFPKAYTGPVTIMR